jgi:hypothetical protein
MKVGDTVMLKANLIEEWERQVATVLEITGDTILVEVDHDENDPYDPDGLREITADQIEEVVNA